MKTAVAAALMVLTVGCGSSDQPEAAPSSSARGWTTSTTTTAATAATASRADWEREIRAAAPRTKCQGADAFAAGCVVALEKFASTIERLAKTVASSGGEYVDAGLKALEVRDAARKWNEQCVTQPPDVRSKRGCLVALYAATNGDDSILAALYATSATR